MKVLALAKTVTFEEMMVERFPEIDSRRFGSVSLEQVAKDQLQKLSSVS
ncbi:MAG: hypothetical protein GQ542_04460 [Desulforhopalus sp.]|nr:hypothetical protein [Desulforhopalus sp.]